MKFRALAIAVSASAMILSPVAAQAGTKAASVSAPVTYGAHSTASVGAKKKASATSAAVLAALGAGATGLGVAAAAGAFKSDRPGPRTPGAL